MPRFAANLSMLYPELPFLDRFAAAAPRDAHNQRLLEAVHPRGWANPAPADRYHLVVLGAGIQNGQPRPALAARLDTAAALARLQPEALIAVCGGQVWGTTDPEAEVMARYQQERHGIAPDRLVLEKDSTSTELNLALSRPLLEARGVAATVPLALVTSDFHLPRALRIAQRQGFTHMVPVAAPTPLATRYNAWLREYFATPSSWVLNEG